MQRVHLIGRKAVLEVHLAVTPRRRLAGAVCRGYLAASLSAGQEGSQEKQAQATILATSERGHEETARCFRAQGRQKRFMQARCKHAQRRILRIWRLQPRNHGSSSSGDSVKSSKSRNIRRFGCLDVFGCFSALCMAIGHEVIRSLGEVIMHLGRSKSSSSGCVMEEPAHQPTQRPDATRQVSQSVSGLSASMMQIDPFFPYTPRPASGNPDIDRARAV